MSNRARWAGRVVSGLAVLFLIFDGVIKFTKAPAVAESFTQLGYPAGLAISIGVLELCCLAVYLIPRSAVVGAILLTGYLGGAVATHVRVGNPLFSHILFPLYVAALIWGGLYLRDSRVRVLLSRP